MNVELNKKHNWILEQLNTFEFSVNKKNKTNLKHSVSIIDYHNNKYLCAKNVKTKLLSLA